MSIILFTLGSLLAALLPLPATAIAVLIAMPLMILYSYYLKALPLLGNITIAFIRSEEHTSELQSHSDLVCRLLLEKKNKKKKTKKRKKKTKQPSVVMQLNLQTSTN
mgnify:CR=1 FL=1